MAAHATLSSVLLLLLLAALWAPGRAQMDDAPPPPANEQPGPVSGADAASVGLCLPPCRENQQCLSDNTCACVENYVNVSGDCVEANTYLGQSCTHNSTCQMHLGGYSVCEGGKCACSRDGVVANSTCYKKIGLNERCTFKEQCVLVENSDCTLGVCACLQGFVPYHVQNTSSCIPVVDTLGGRCNISSQCNQGKLGIGATCVARECKCQYEYYYSSSTGTCLYKKVLDEECNPEKGTGCYLEEDGDNQHIECKDGVCQCTENFQASSDRQACETITTTSTTTRRTTTRRTTRRTTTRRTTTRRTTKKPRKGGASQVQLSALTFLLLFVAYIAK